ncbi:MAG: RNA polymerase sigma factor [Flavobacteriaceae bacterium]|nr:RNA polymerase sigma factor [Flavobacteriaceae bacterium]
MTQLELQYLLNKAKKGNAKAQLKVYDAYCDAMYAVAYRYCKRSALAEEALQDAFLKAFTKLEHFHHQSSFGAWLRKIVIHTALDLLRKEKKYCFTLEEQELQQQAAPDIWEVPDRVQKQEIVEAVASLDEKYQLVLQLYLFEGYDQGEIAQIMQIPIRTVKTRFRRGRLQVQELLKKQYETN